MKRVAFIIPKLSGGGAERVVSNLSLYLSNNEYEKYIILFDDSNDKYPYDANLISLDTKVSMKFIGKLSNFIRRINKVKRLKRELNIDTYISFLPGPNLINILTRQKEKVIVSVRIFPSKIPKGFYNSMNKLLMKFFYNKADSIISVSKAAKYDLATNFNLHEDLIRVIYNPYNLDQINKSANEQINEFEKSIFSHPTIVTAGRLSEQKGQWHLIRAFKIVKQKIPDAKLVILGEGPLKSYLETLIADSGYENDIYLLGFKSNPFKYIKQSSVYAFPSLYEGFPNALCEAMACGIAVISTDCPSGPREILSPSSPFHKYCSTIEEAEFGLLTPVCDGTLYKYNDPITVEENNLANAIALLLQDNNLNNKYKRASHKRMLELDYKQIISLWEIEIS